MLGNINSDNLGIALGPATCQATPGCVPFNFFGGAGSITPAMMDYVTFVQRDSSKQRNWNFSANPTGGLTELQGGQLGVAMGVEYRKLVASLTPIRLLPRALARISRPTDERLLQCEGSLCRAQRTGIGE